MTVTTRRRGARIGLRIATAAVIIGGYGAVEHGIADAHDGSVTVSAPECPENAPAIKRATITVTNLWDAPAKAFTASLSGGFHTIAPHDSWSFTETTGSSTVGNGSTELVRLDWADGVSKTKTFQVNWGSAPCPGQDTTTTTSTIPGCPDGQHYSPVPPVGCYPNATTIPTEPPATNVPEPSTAPPATTVAPGPTTTGASQKVVVQGPPKSTPPGPKTPLPATGSEDTNVIIAGIGSLGMGALLIGLGSRRRSAS